MDATLGKRLLLKAIWVQTLQFLYKKNVGILNIHMDATLGKSHLGSNLAIFIQKTGYLLNFATWVLFWVLFQRKD